MTAVLAALEPWSVWLGMLIGGIAVGLFTAVGGWRGWLGDDTGTVDWSEYFGVVAAGVAPVLAIVGGLIVWLAT